MPPTGCHAGGTFLATWCASRTVAKRCGRVGRSVAVEGWPQAQAGQPAQGRRAGSGHCRHPAGCQAGNALLGFSELLHMLVVTLRSSARSPGRRVRSHLVPHSGLYSRSGHSRPPKSDEIRPPPLATFLSAIYYGEFENASHKMAASEESEKCVLGGAVCFLLCPARVAEHTPGAQPPFPGLPNAPQAIVDAFCQRL